MKRILSETWKETKDKFPNKPVSKYMYRYLSRPEWSAHDTAAALACRWIDRASTKIVVHDIIKVKIHDIIFLIHL